MTTPHHRTEDKPLSGHDAETLTTFVKDNVTAGSIVRTDGWQGYRDGDCSNIADNADTNITAPNPPVESSGDT